MSGFLTEPLLAEFLARFQEIRKENENEIPSFTRIYKNGELICEAINSVETSEDSSLHSEVLAISKAKEIVKERYLTDCILLTTLEPCLMCGGSILLSRIPKVAYLVPAKPGEGISSLSLETIYSRNFFPELILFRSEETKQIFKTFFKDKRN
ncbi:nucleoside deaminase [Leptospira wolffii]|uniref:Cytidine deaminase n=1 Tax=Leptospira wolffii TaxID=409998 RepID=A0A2M9ZEK3_9LEPT|nr:nucleoside deaminase [Leptospira wolffii]PJZ66871.1 cytidine deaminase [Leptospira wolffii]TGK61841.1 nucleoside deaminase [Leptospira wolffii]TGK65928.1 nucleoside deaminase [Leptospira wolffii]TGK74775.1 nucleoside deaminase [Leptospira wolffii]TGL30841.1 nucleoside deaminase [Leptospira wolffii]